MVTSLDTIQRIHKVLTTHLTGKQIRLILDDLTMVPGNQSFRETIVRLQHYHLEKMAKGKVDVAISEKKEQGRQGT